MIVEVPQVGRCVCLLLCVYARVCVCLLLQEYKASQKTQIPCSAVNLYGREGTTGAQTLWKIVSV